MVRKLGLPGNPELALGAVASGGALLLNQEMIERFGVLPELIQTLVENECDVIKRRESAYGTGKQPVGFPGKIAVLVDDGAATGATIRVAVKALRSLNPDSLIVVALPAASSQAADQLRAEADEVFVLIESDNFLSVGQWYRNFDQTTDEEVMECLRKAAREHSR